MPLQLGRIHSNAKLADVPTLAEAAVTAARTCQLYCRNGQDEVDQFPSVWKRNVTKFGAKSLNAELDCIFCGIDVYVPRWW